MQLFATLESLAGKFIKIQSNSCSDAAQTGGQESGWSPWDIWDMIVLFICRHSKKVQTGREPPCAEKSLALTHGDRHSGLMMPMRLGG